LFSGFCGVVKTSDVKVVFMLFQDNIFANWIFRYFLSIRILQILEQKN